MQQTENMHTFKVEHLNGQATFERIQNIISPMRNRKESYGEEQCFGIPEVT
jgi:hypothetical protein